MRLAVLMTCHNRQAITLECLNGLMLQLGSANKVFLFDDGSADGTAEAVVKEFPTVRVIKGDGSLYWAKGMRKAWEAAVAERNDWDEYLWLNDDTELNADAVQKLLAAIFASATYLR